MPGTLGLDERLAKKSVSSANAKKNELRFVCERIAVGPGQGDDGPACLCEQAEWKKILFNSFNYPFAAANMGKSTTTIPTHYRRCTRLTAQKNNRALPLVCNTPCNPFDWQPLQEQLGRMLLMIRKVRRFHRVHGYRQSSHTYTAPFCVELNFLINYIIFSAEAFACAPA